MAKRELISREEVLSHPFANGKYDHKNADINFILGHESYKEWLETLPVFTEQDIVKHVLEKIRTEIEDIDTNYYSSVNGVDMTECADDMKHGILEIIDKCKEESEGE